MATVKPEPVIGAQLKNRVQVLWEALATGDTITAYEPPFALAAGSITFTPTTAGGATLTFEASDDGVSWLAMNDIEGTPISHTAAGRAEITCSARFIRPAIAGGTSDDWNIYMTGWT